MKKLLVKYLILIIITFAISICIYDYVESFKPVSTEGDILAIQKQAEEGYFANTDYTIDNPNVILNPYGNSPLSAIIVFQTNDLTTATVTIKGKDGASDIVHTFTPSKVHILPIYGLYAGYENKVIIEVSGKSKEVIIKTDDLPSDFAKVEDVKSSDTSEFYFTTPEDTGYTAAYDCNGEVRWYIVGDYKWDIQRLSNGHILMSSDKMILDNYSVGLMEMDLLGKVYFEYVIPGGYHHNVFELNNGNLLTISNNLDGDTIEDYIVEIDRNTGNIIKKIDLSSILKNNKKGNWFKATSLVYDVNTNSITISGYNSDMIVNIDYSSLNINWVIGEKIPDNLKDYSLKADGDVHYPSKPLSINLLSDNQFIFVNYSDGKRRLDTYKVDYSNRTFKEVSDYELSSNSDAYLEIHGNDKWIITQGNNIKEIENEEVVQSFTINSSLYNTKKMPLYANDIYTGVLGVRLGFLGQSKPLKNYPVFSTKKDESIIKKYKINLYKDVYGLRVSGDFSKKDKVDIILENVLDKKTYGLNTDNGYSYRYINEDGIKGKYYIYLKINGTVYKLDKCVTFY